MPWATAALTALRWSGLLIVIRSTRSRRSVSTACSCVTLGRRSPSGLALWRPRDSSGRSEQSQIGLALAAQDVEIHLHAVDPAGLGEHARLRLDRLRREHAAARLERRVASDPLEIAGQLLHRLDSGDAFDLDRDPAVRSVATHQIDRTDVGRPLPPDQPE